MINILNVLKKSRCKSPGHIPVIRYVGICVDGYQCADCGYQWYEKKKRRPKLTLVKNTEDMSLLDDW